jgi:hypothetical protein
LPRDGSVLIIGGQGPASQSASAEVFDPKTRTFRATGSLKVGRLWVTAAGTFGAAGSMTQSREFHSATLLSDGRVLLAGGQVPRGQGVASAELFKP